jgi:biopolymer transport protein ExbD
MAGQASEDDAVSLNVTPLIDIIFCLCIFFICSFHFKELQGKIDSWLPKDKGPNGGAPVNPLDEEIRVFVRSKSGVTELAFGARVAGSAADLESLVKAAWDELLVAGKKAHVVIDAEPTVPWRDVMEILDRCRIDGIDRVEFAGEHGAEPREFEEPMPGVR